MSIDRSRRSVADRWSPVSPGDAASEPELDVAAEVLDFIRFCYRRRGIGWPELYDEMCAVAARGLFQGIDYDRLAALGVGFSLWEMPRLAALAQRVVADERRAAAARRTATTPAPVALAPSPTAG